MSKEIKLQVPDLLFSSLQEEADGQSVSIEAFCLSLLQVSFNLIDPSSYSLLNALEVRNEIQRVSRSGLPSEEIKRRVRTLETQLTGFIK